MSTTQQTKPRRNAVALVIRSHGRAALVLAAAVVFQLAFIASFTGAMSRPTLQDATLGLVASPAASRPAAAAVPQVTGVSYQVLPSPAAAAAQVRDGALPAALLIGARNDTLVVAGAAGLSLVTAITEEVSAHAARADVPVAVEDVRPLPPGDPRGLGSYLLVLGWIIGGYLGITLLGRVRGAAGASVRGTAVTLGMAALYSVASAALGVALVDPLMGVLTGHPWTLFAAGSLIVFATTVVTAALTSLVGLPGIVIAIVMFVVLGNPTSGGSVPVQMLAGGYRFLAGVLPTNAAMGLVRGFAYFGGNQIARPLLVLSIYAGASLAACLGLALRRAHAAVAKESAARAGTGEAGTGEAGTGEAGTGEASTGRGPRAAQHVALPTGASR
jgi:hypothetical protein